MKKILILLVLTTSVIHVRSQDPTVQELKKEGSRDVAKDPNDTLNLKWKTGGIATVTANQGTLSNWAAGGDRATLSISSIVSLFAYFKEGRHSWDNNLDLAYGYVSTTSLGIRKSDDRIDFISRYGYQLTKKWYAGALLNFRTQFTRGYDYPEEGGRVLTSEFMAPAYIVLSPGISYQKPSDNFSIFLSPVTARWVVVTSDSLSRAGAYGVDPGKTARFEIGAFASISFRQKISENASFQSRMDLFSNYRRQPQNVDLFWTNLLVLKVTKLISVNLSVDMIYDNDVNTVKDDGSSGGPKLQIKQLLGVGLAYRFKNY